MKNLISTALRYEDKQLAILNQQKLPGVEEWIVCTSSFQMCEIIHSLQIRGAPLIGIAAAISLANYAENGASLVEIYKAATALKAARPTAVNLAHCINKQLSELDSSQDPLSIVVIAEELFFEDMRLCNNIASHGITLISPGDNVLTHCNTGKLVTAGIGTALGIILKAHENGQIIHVYVDETRPLLQGGRLTVWELQQEKIPYTLICDNMAASLMRLGKIQKIIVGADRIAANGDFANKIGTYNLAVLAHHHGIPFYVAAPYTTLDLNCSTGDSIKIEERSGDEVRGASGHFGKIIWTLPDAPVFNPAFDVTPAELVTAYILDSGVIKPQHLNQIKKPIHFE
jgi:methylthioribose-1-phosphate isomerase